MLGKKSGGSHSVQECSQAELAGRTGERSEAEASGTDEGVLVVEGNLEAFEAA